MAIYSLSGIGYFYAYPKIDIISISAIGIIISAFLVVTHNFYLKEEDKIEE